FYLDPTNITVADLEDLELAEDLALPIKANEEHEFSREQARHTELSFCVRSDSWRPPIAYSSYSSRLFGEIAAMQLDPGHRLPALRRYDTAIDAVSLLLLGDYDVYTPSLGSFTDLYDFRF